LQEKYRAPGEEEPFLAEKGRRPRASKTRGADFARACAVEAHMTWTSSHSTRKFTGKRENAGAQKEHLDQAPALTCTMRSENPSVWGHTVWGKKNWTKPKNWSNATFTSKNQDLIRYMDVSQDSSGYDCRLVHPSRWVLELEFIDSIIRLQKKKK